MKIFNKNAYSLKFKLYMAAARRYALHEASKWSVGADVGAREAASRQKRVLNVFCCYTNRNVLADIKLKFFCMRIIYINEQTHEQDYARRAACLPSG